MARAVVSGLSKYDGKRYAIICDYDKKTEKVELGDELAR